MYTIVFHDGTHKHIQDGQAAPLLKAFAGGDKHVVLAGKLYAFSSVSRIEPSKEWLEAQREKFLGADLWFCDYGHKHGRGEKCRCVDLLRLPLTADAARDTLALLADGKRDGSLTDRGAALWEKNYPQLLAAAYPDLRTLLP